MHACLVKPVCPARTHRCHWAQALHLHLSLSCIGTASPCSSARQPPVHGAPHQPHTLVQPAQPCRCAAAPWLLLRCRARAVATRHRHGVSSACCCCCCSESAAFGGRSWAANKPLYPDAPMSAAALPGWSRPASALPQLAAGLWGLHAPAQSARITVLQTGCHHSRVLHGLEKGLSAAAPSSSLIELCAALGGCGGSTCVQRGGRQKNHRITDQEFLITMVL